MKSNDNILFSSRRAAQSSIPWHDGGKKNTQRHFNYTAELLSQYLATPLMFDWYCAASTKPVPPFPATQLRRVRTRTGDLRGWSLSSIRLSYAINSELDMDLWSPSPNCCITPSWTASVVCVAHYWAEEVLPAVSGLCMRGSARMWLWKAEYCHLSNL